MRDEFGSVSKHCEGNCQAIFTEQCWSMREALINVSFKGQNMMFTKTTLAHVVSGTACSAETYLMITVSVGLWRADEERSAEEMIIYC